MNKTTTHAEAQGTIQAIVIMQNGDRVERTVTYNVGAIRGLDTWQNAMRKVGAGLVGGTFKPEQIATLVTITGDKWGTNVSTYGGPTEAREILGFDAE
jgi:hypothetical protein